MPGRLLDSRALSRYTREVRVKRRKINADRKRHHFEYEVVSFFPNQTSCVAGPCLCHKTACGEMMLGSIRRSAKQNAVWRKKKEEEVLNGRKNARKSDAGRENRAGRKGQ